LGQWSFQLFPLTAKLIIRKHMNNSGQVGALRPTKDDIL
jgi:hypothetical protein